MAEKLDAGATFPAITLDLVDGTTIAGTGDRTVAGSWPASSQSSVN